MNDDLFSAAVWLVNAIARGLEKRPGAATAEVLRRLSMQDVSRPAFVKPPAQSLPVTRYFAETIAEAMLMEPDIAAALAAADGHFNWRQSASYTDAVLGAGFSLNYGWFEVIGPRGFFLGDDFLLGFLMLGPNRHYTDHYHPAPELYWPLTGPTLWKQGAGDFEAKQAGDIIWHAPNANHATKTADHAMLAVWSWTKDTATGARLAEA